MVASVSHARWKPRFLEQIIPDAAGRFIACLSYRLIGMTDLPTLCSSKSSHVRLGSEELDRVQQIQLYCELRVKVIRT